MKKEFSISWRASSQVRKQRKYKANAPLHILHKFLGANLSKELRKKYSRRSFPVRKNDLVKVMRGKFAGKTGKIAKINLKRMKISIEGIQIQKKDGTKINIYFHPSKLQIQELSLDDKERLEAIKRHENKEGKESKEGKNASEKK